MQLVRQIQFRHCGSLKYSTKIILAAVILWLSASACSSVLKAQAEADIWVQGYHANLDPSAGILYFNFSGNDLNITHNSIIPTWSIDGTNASICDSLGQLRLVSNGTTVFDYQSIEWFDTLGYGPYWQLNEKNGMPGYGGAVILPMPQSLFDYAIIYEKHPDTGLFIHASGVYFSQLRAFEDNVPFFIIKDSIVFESALNRRQGLAATRHANGRDWWVLQMDSDSKYYFKFLLDSHGLHFIGKDSSSIVHPLGFDQMGFSPSGGYFTRSDIYPNDSIGQFISLFQFDRCKGRLTFVDTIRIETSYFVGNAFSPSERFLYGTQNDLLWQWDLESTDIKLSRTLVDSNNYYTWPGWLPETFGSLVNAPDGKIYLISANGGSHSMSIIHRPDEPADQCRFIQNDIILPVWTSRSPPNLPNYRLGPLDGSPCDTLGLNNLPVSRWRFELEGPLVPEVIRFTDLSYFRPEEWHWDFGDGMTSDTSHPIHTYDSPGWYHACLTVSNEYASDSMCRWIEIVDTILSVTHPVPFSFQIYPNPFTDHIDISSEEDSYHLYTVSVTDLTGSSVVSAQMIIPGRLMLPSLPPGMYVVQILENQRLVWAGKMLKIDTDR